MMTLEEYRQQLGLGDPDDGTPVYDAADYAQLIKQSKLPNNGTSAASSRRPVNAESLLFGQIVLAKLPIPERQYKFDESRKWAVDFAWPDYGLVMEVEGGIWLQAEDGRSTGHAHPIRFMKDIEKYNALAMAGFFLLRATPDQVKDQTAITVLMEWFAGQKAQKRQVDKG
jgi:very-short-patch-repair endonuclease